MTPESSSLQETDDQAAAVATAPRISKEFIEQQIVETTFTTGDELVPDALVGDYSHLTICTLRVNNGFIVIGKSAPMSPLNYNAKLGQLFAYEDAFRQLWPLYAFAALQEDWLDEQESKAELKRMHEDNEPEPPNSAESKPAE